MVRHSLYIVAAILALPMTGHAQTVQFSSALMDVRCIPNGQPDPSDMQVNVRGTMNGGTRDTVGGVLARIKQLGGGPHLFRGHLNVNVHNGGRPTRGGGSSCASFSSGNSTVELVQNCRGPSDWKSTAAHLAHEIGHVVGQNGFYNSYASNTPKCMITHYCGASHGYGSRNEEFAEVFATYLHAPNSLKTACPKAFEFMRTYVFRNGPDPITASCTGNPNPPSEGPASNGYGYGGDSSHTDPKKNYSWQEYLKMIMDQLNKPKEPNQSAQPPPQPAPAPMIIQSLPPGGAPAVRETPAVTQPWANQYK